MTITQAISTVATKATSTETTDIETTPSADEIVGPEFESGDGAGEIPGND